MRIQSHHEGTMHNYDTVLSGSRLAMKATVGVVVVATAASSNAVPRSETP